MTKRLYISAGELALLEGCTEQTARKRLKKIKPKGKVTFREYAEHRNINLSEVLTTLSLN